MRGLGTAEGQNPVRADASHGIAVPRGPGAIATTGRCCVCVFHRVCVICSCMRFLLRSKKLMQELFTLREVISLGLPELDITLQNARETNRAAK